MLALFGLAMFFMGGEEISWFSRLFRYSVSAVEMSNEQREMTVHNLKSFLNHLEAFTGSIFLLLYGIALPLAVRSSSPAQRIATSWAIPVPPMRYPNMSLPHPAEHLIETDIALKRYAGVLGTSAGASYNRLLLLSGEKPKRAETIARLADSKVQEDLILASINAAITSGYLDKDDAKRQRLKEAEQLVDQQLADGAPTASLIVLKATVICLQEGAKPALSFLRSRSALKPLRGFQRTNVMGFINQRNCAK
jgi:hypothetical protein